MDGLPEFRLHKPSSVAEAVELRRQDPSARFLAGGTDLIVNMRRGIASPGALIDVSAIAEMRRLASGPGGLTVGAAVTLEELCADTRIVEQWGLLAGAAGNVAAPSHRQAATVGGNLCLDTRCVYYNQSEWWRRANGYCLKSRGEVCHVAPSGTRCLAAFCGDLAPALLVLGAEADIADPQGIRSLPLPELYSDDGADHLRLAVSALPVAVPVPVVGDLRTGYHQVRVHQAIDFPLAGAAVALRRDADTLAELRLALTGTNPRPILIEGCDGLCGGPLDGAALGRLEKLVRKQVQPMRTTVTPSHYRRRVAANVARRLVERLYSQA